MSIQVATSPKNVYSQQEFPGPRSVLSTSGLRTPRFFYDHETQRHSVTSSYTSIPFGSYLSEFQPMTPTYGQSLVPGEGFTDGVHSNLGPGIQSQSFYGDNLHPPWMPGMQRPVMSSSISSHLSEVPPRNGGSLHAHTNGQMSLEVPPVLTPDIWANIPVMSQSDAIRTWAYPGFPAVVPEGRIQPLSTDKLQYAQDTHVTPTTSSEVIAGIEDDYIYVMPEPSTNADLHDELGLCFAPSQNISLNKASPRTKHGFGNDESEVQLTRSIYVSPIGGKSVIQERKIYTEAPKDKNGVSKPDVERVDVDGIEVTLAHDGVICEWDAGTETVKSRRTRVQQPKQQCRFCQKEFKRREHLARHVRIHDKERPYVCPVCEKLFDRNDNRVAHFLTHLKVPGKRGRNKKMSFEELEAYISVEEMKRVRLMHQSSLRKAAKRVARSCLV